MLLDRFKESSDVMKSQKNKTGFPAIVLFTLFTVYPFITNIAMVSPEPEYARNDLDLLSLV